MEIDRTELQDSARRMFPGDKLAPAADKSWELIVEAGWLGLSAPEALGGLEQGRPAQGVLYAELGRVVAPVPFLPAMLAMEAVCRAPDLADRQGWVDRILGGELVTASLLPKPVSASVDAAGAAVVSGALEAVVDADQATHLLVWADEMLGLVALDQSGVAREPRRAWDATRRLFDVRLAGAQIAPELVLARGPAAAELARELQIHLEFALAADSLGGGAALLDMSVEYLQTRRQFGRPLAMFQALKHRCADLRTQLAAAEALFWKLAEGIERSAFDPLTEAGALKAHAAGVYYAIAEEAIQLHGGIGLTAEHPCHLFMKRALLNTALGGEADAWEEAAGRDALQRLVQA
jgi:alkylation response protein AidB-like acyl-CoA dehydrogenase